MPKDYVPNQQTGAQETQEAALAAALLELITRVGKQVKTTPELGPDAQKAITNHLRIAAQLVPNRLTKEELLRALEPSTDKPSPKAT